jgi:hypothetical protein
MKRKLSENDKRILIEAARIKRRLTKTYDDEFRKELINDMWELGKETFGVRPRWVDFDSKTTEELLAMADSWTETFKAERAVSQKREGKNDAAFERGIAQLASATGASREEAIFRYFMEHYPEIVEEQYSFDYFIERAEGLSPAKSSEVDAILQQFIQPR